MMPSTLWIIGTAILFVATVISCYLLYKHRNTDEASGMFFITVLLLSGTMAAFSETVSELKNELNINLQKELELAPKK